MPRHAPTAAAPAAAARSPFKALRAWLQGFQYSEDADPEGAFVGDPARLARIGRRQFKRHLAALERIVAENRVNRRDRVLNIFIGLALCVIVIGVVILVPNLLRYARYGLSERNARRRLDADRARFRARFGTPPG
ncbi:hypothetical protein SAMN05216241_11057 [Limimonas halophila]|uniref:Uncharacterized protein n=1 Tax=Limimonas halophila TaxID=1082479 RepID=A0A1G7TSB4_9PROT|nr:hypothetical protein [Limimonas halophila]SDG38216.1 hypothetical protein SAMN05216241_11057 [Limimonas halophila]